VGGIDLDVVVVSAVVARYQKALALDRRVEIAIPKRTRRATERPPPGPARRRTTNRWPGTQQGSFAYISYSA
jgi:hypothetical protein